MRLRSWTRPLYMPISPTMTSTTSTTRRSARSPWAPSIGLRPVAAALGAAERALSGRRCARRARGSARPGDPSRTPGPARPPEATRSASDRRIGEHPAQRGRQRADVSGAHEQRVPTRPGPRWRSRAASLATTGVSAAMASSSTTPNDSPRSDGAQKTSAPRRRAAFSSSVMRPSHSMRRSPATRARRRSVSGPSPAIQSRTWAGSSVMASSSTSSPLRGSWRPMKKMVGPSVGHGDGLGERSPPRRR